MRSYDYKTRKGVRSITWEDYQAYCQTLAEKVSKIDIDIVLGIARGGLYPATLISGMLRKEFYPVRITRRENDIVKFKNPIWKTDVTNDVLGKNVLIIDDIADQGQTLQLVAQRAKEKSAHKITTTSLITHSWANPKPDYYALESDELIVFPWDTKILIKGVWQLHPEIEEAMKLQ